MEYNDTLYGTWFLNDSNSTTEYGDYSLEGGLITFVIYIIIAFTFLISLAGLLGNGIVLWILGFRTKKNSFTIYILNLSIADFSVLAALASLYTCSILIIHCHLFLYVCIYIIFSYMFSASQFLLTAISIDRCVCIFFPLWHKCHRPPHLSIIICTVIWVLTFLVSVTPIIHLFTADTDYFYINKYLFLLNALLSTPAMTFSTLAMIIKVCLLSPQHRRGKLLTAILLALIFFLLFAFPMNCIEYSYSPSSLSDVYVHEYGMVSASLNSSVNPLIYYLIGRRNRGRSRSTVKKILEKLFVEEENCEATPEPTLQTEL